jgi:hypothetical protein
MFNRESTYTAPLVIGSRVHCILYGGKDGVIYDIRGTQNPGSCRTLGGGIGVMGGSADFSIVWDDGTESRGTPESLIRSSVQWEVLDGIASADEINAMRGAAILETNRRADEQKAKNEKFAANVAALRSDRKYSHLTQIQKGEYKGAAFAAANLRKELKLAFPGIKFSVRSDSFSGGDSIDVAWTDGPTTKEVDRIANKYSAGSFDGMEDLYNYESTAWTTVFGDAKYVHTQRHYSAPTLQDAVNRVCSEFRWEPLKVESHLDSSAYVSCDDHDRQRQVYDCLEKRNHYEKREPQPGDAEYEALKAKVAELERQKLRG